MKDLSLMKRITDIRDDLIENAYLPLAVPLPTPRPRFSHMSLLGRLAIAAAACIVSLGVIVGVGIPAYTNWIKPALSGTDTETEEASEPAEDGTEKDSAEMIRLSLEVIPEVVKPGETVEIRITIEECHVEMVALTAPILTYGTIPVSSEVFSYESEYKYANNTKPVHYTLTIPENAPAGEYDLSQECVGLETTVTFEKVLTVTERDDAKDNTHLWISSENGTVSPLLWVYASREVYVWDDPSAYEFWGYSYGDGIGYMDYPSAKLDELPTTVWSEDLIFYNEGEVRENPEITVYDLDGNVIAYKRRSEIADILESGIYYFCISDSYYGDDHFEEAMEVAKSIAEAYQEDVTEMQSLVVAELDKDPYAFRDKYYCEHVFRVIIP